MFHPGLRWTCNYTFSANKKLHCASRSGHTADRTVDLEQALLYSCNTYFYHLSYHWLGAQPIERWARRLGLGRPTGVDLPASQFESGFLAPPATVKGTQVCHYAIGQVHVRATPLQILRMISAIATDGEVRRPHLVTTNAPRERIAFANPRTLPVIRAGLWHAAHRVGGTAARDEFELRPYRVACKTGTAEATNAGGLYHAWLAGYAPAYAPGERRQAPRIAFVIVLENTTLNAGAACAPVARGLLKHFAGQDPGAYLVNPALVEPREGNAQRRGGVEQGVRPAEQP